MLMFFGFSPIHAGPEAGYPKGTKAFDGRTFVQNLGTLPLAGAGWYATSVEPPLLVLKVVDLGQPAGARPNTRHQDH